MLVRNYWRLTGYAQIGYRVLAAKNQPNKISMIYDAKSFVEVMKNDIAGAKKEILIVSPFIRKKRIEIIIRKHHAIRIKGISRRIGSVDEFLIIYSPNRLWRCRR